ncbi:hypothetical protein [Demequina pelophila]|uniref:hypothetical protein n=1 Tax=Demequina pelophila TaxID=1638984 RepID=UPI0007832AAD|nr:hypothetical protein [Demequina pelophila]
MTGKTGDARQASLDLIRTLLAIADGGSPYPEERERARERAERLMVRLAIDEAGVRMSKEEAAAPEQREFHFDAPYILDQQGLVFRIASVFACRGVRYPSGRMVVVGFASDLAMVAALAGSLVPAMRLEMDAMGGSASRKKAFAMAYAATVKSRLQDFYAGALREAEQEGTGSALVLADRSVAVDEAMVQMFPGLRAGRARQVRDYAGWMAGSAAGERADISLGRKVEEREARAIGG